MRILLLLALGSLACGRDKAAPAPAPAAIVDRVVARAKAAHPDLEVSRVDDRTVRLRGKDGVETTINIDNVATQCANAPADCDAAIAKTVDGIVEARRAETDSAPRRELVRAVLKDTASVDAMKQQVAAAVPDNVEANLPVFRPLAGDVWITYVFDYPNSTTVVSTEQMKKLSLDPASLHDLAMRNLAAAFTSLPYQPIAAGSPIQVVSVGDEYEASRLLVPALWKPLASGNKRLLAVVPARHILLFTTSSKPEDVATLRQLAEKTAAEEHHPISPILLEWTDTGWIVAR